MRVGVVRVLAVQKHRGGDRVPRRAVFARRQRGYAGRHERAAVGHRRIALQQLRSKVVEGEPVPEHRRHMRTVLRRAGLALDEGGHGDHRASRRALVATREIRRPRHALGVRCGHVGEAPREGLGHALDHTPRRAVRRKVVGVGKEPSLERSLGAGRAHGRRILGRREEVSRRAHAARLEAPRDVEAREALGDRHAYQSRAASAKRSQDRHRREVVAERHGAAMRRRGRAAEGREEVKEPRSIDGVGVPERAGDGARGGILVDGDAHDRALASMRRAQVRKRRGGPHEQRDDGHGPDGPSRVRRRRSGSRSAGARRSLGRRRGLRSLRCPRRLRRYGSCSSGHRPPPERAST